MTEAPASSLALSGKGNPDESVLRASQLLKSGLSRVASQWQRASCGMRGAIRRFDYRIARKVRTAAHLGVAVVAAAVVPFVASAHAARQVAPSVRQLE